MRIILALLVGLLLLLGVTYVRYKSVYSQMSRDEQEIARACAAAHPRISYGPGSLANYADPRAESCRRQAEETYHAGDSRRYFLGAWLWGIIAGLIGAITAFKLVGRRSRASEPAAHSLT